MRTIKVKCEGCNEWLVVYNRMVNRVTNLIKENKDLEKQIRDLKVEIEDKP